MKTSALSFVPPHGSWLVGSIMRLCLVIVLGLCVLECGAQTLTAQENSPQIATLREMKSAVNAGDATRYAHVYASDAVITIMGGTQLKERQAIEQYEASLLRQFPGTTLAFYDIWQQELQAVVRYCVRGSSLNGRRMGHEGLLFYRFDPSGLILDERRYNDSLTPMAQLGLLGKVPTRPVPTLPKNTQVHSKGSPGEGENLEIARAILTAINSRDESGFSTRIDDEIVIDEMMLQHPFVGKRNAKKWFDLWTEAVPDATTQVTNLIAIDDSVFVESVVEGSLQRPFGPLSASNRRFSVHRAAIFQFRSGKLHRCAYFTNGKEFAESIGQWPLSPRAAAVQETYRSWNGLPGKNSTFSYILTKGRTVKHCRVETKGDPLTKNWILTNGRSMDDLSMQSIGFKVLRGYGGLTVQMMRIAASDTSGIGPGMPRDHLLNLAE